MQYRRFGKLDWNASVLGFGCMRFPTHDGNAFGGNINEPEAIRMLRHAIDNGINYVDTAYVYHDGKSEVVVGKALKDGYRDKVRLATKLPVWMLESSADFDRVLNEQLERLQTDHIDFYLLHSLNQERWRDNVLKFDLLTRAKAALADGRIRHLGFSIHDNYDVLAEILDGSDLWRFCQIQYNYMDTENQTGTRGLRLAASKGLAVVIMEPLMGGRLADPPKDVLAVMEEAPKHRSPVDWALGWLWNQPEVTVVLSGMNSFAQVEENLRLADTARSGSLTAPDLELIAKITEIYRSRMAVQCSKCGYCMPCPNGVNIPGNFDFFNYAHLYDDIPGGRFRYEVFLKPEQRSNACIACGVCADLCPQKIEIPEQLAKVTALLA